MSLTSARGRVVLALLALYLIWGSTYYAMRVALESLPPLLMAATRYLIAGGGLFIVARASGARLPTRRQWGSALFLGVFLLVGGNGIVAYSQQWASSSLAAIVVATMPLWAALFARLSGQRVSPIERVGLWVGVAGVALLNIGGDIAALSPAALVLLLAPVCWAFGSMFSRRLDVAVGPMGIAAMMSAGGAVMLALGVLRGESIQALPSARSSVALAYLVVFGSIVALTAYTFLLRRVRPALATSYAYVNPAIAVLIGVFWGNERVRPMTLLALGVILAGVLLVTSGSGLARLLPWQRRLSRHKA